MSGDSKAWDITPSRPPESLNLIAIENGVINLHEVVSIGCHDKQIIVQYRGDKMVSMFPDPDGKGWEKIKATIKQLER